MQHDHDNNPNAWARELVQAGYALVPCPRGEKGPRASGWNRREAAITTLEEFDARVNGTALNFGITHAYCSTPTCAIDIDDMDAARAWLAARGVDLDELFDAPDAVLINSGTEGHGKLLYRLPAGEKPLPQKKYRPSGAPSDVIDFRCATSDGLTVHDVAPGSLHPTGRNYQWGGAGDWRELPEIPAALLRIWKELLGNAPSVTQQDLGDWEQVDLAHYPEIPADIRALIENGVEQGRRSDVLMRVTLALDSLGIDRRTIACILCDPQHGLSAKAWEKGNYDQAGAMNWQAADVNRIVSKRGRGDVLAYFSDLTQDPEHLADERARKDREEQARGEKASDIARRFMPKTVSAGFETSEINRRQWVIGGRLLRGYVSVDFAPGGLGKSTISVVEGLAVAAGRDLIGLGALHERTNVLLINNEDDQEELERRVQATLRCYNITGKEIEGRFFYLSGYGDPFLIADSPDGKCIEPGEAVAHIAEFCRRHDIGVVIFDPLVSLHSLDENDNSKMDAVVGRLKNFAKETGTAIRVVAHTRKVNSGRDSEAYAGDAESGRGASAITYAARCAHTVARMSKKTAEHLGIPPELARRLIRIDSAKGNYALPDEGATWLKLESVRLVNGEEVGVPVPFDISPYAAVAEREESRKADQEKLKTQLDVLRALGDRQRGKMTTLRDETLAAEWGASLSTVKRRIEVAIPEGKENAVTVPGALDAPDVLLWLERDGKHDNAAIVICRETAPKGAGALSAEDWAEHRAPTAGGSPYPLPSDTGGKSLSQMCR